MDLELNDNFSLARTYRIGSVSTEKRALCKQDMQKHACSRADTSPKVVPKAEAGELTRAALDLQRDLCHALQGAAWQGCCSQSRVCR